VRRTLNFEEPLYPNTPPGPRAPLPELQQLLPGMAIIVSKGDKLDVSPEGIKICAWTSIQSAGTGGIAWQDGIE
jgi:hypothetical protein